MSEEDLDAGRISPIDPDVVARTLRWREILKREAGSHGLMAEALADRSGLDEQRILQVLEDPKALTLQELELLVSVLPLDLGDYFRMVLSYRAADDPPPSLDAWIIRNLPPTGE